MSIFTAAFWRAATERSIKTAAQGAILAGVGVAKFDALHASWGTIGGAALGAALLSLLTSVASDAVTAGNGPSLTDAEVLPTDLTDMQRRLEQRDVASATMSSAVKAQRNKPRARK